MVRLAVILCTNIKANRRKFLDSVRIHLEGGTGGSGYPKYGGIGGKGGDIYVKAARDSTLKQLIELYPSKRIKAGKGEASASFRIIGRPGTNETIIVPTGISILTDEGRCLGNLDKPGDSVKVAKGGPGGGPTNQFFGQKGQNFSVNLDLKLIADVGFVGFPNAGKSTLLKAMSRAKPKIANYPFTTLRPNIGVMEYEDRRQIQLADLPGLIEGAHANLGLGHKFLKHVIRTKMLMFVVDVQGFRLSEDSPFRSAIQTIILLNKELELYDESLVDRPSCLVVTKMDTDRQHTKYKLLLDQLEDIEAQSNQLPQELKPESFINFDFVLPICSHEAYNIVDLKHKVRSLIDVYADLKREDRGLKSYLGSLEKKHKDIIIQ